MRIFTASVWTDPTQILPYDAALGVSDAHLGIGTAKYRWDSVLCVECRKGRGEYADQCDIFIKGTGMFVFEMGDDALDFRTECRISKGTPSYASTMDDGYDAHTVFNIENADIDREACPVFVLSDPSDYIPDEIMLLPHPCGMHILNADSAGGKASKAVVLAAWDWRRIEGVVARYLCILMYVYVREKTYSYSYTSVRSSRR
jgi:hypothetical protein